MRIRILFIFVLVSILPALISAQVAVTGKITGVVTDSSGSAVPNAMVTVKGSALMSPRSTSTGSEGAYLFDLLPPGTYEITVTANGFQTFDETGVEITAGFTATVNPKLQLGEVQQTVKVESEPVVDVQNVQSSTTFDQNLLQDIPQRTRPLVHRRPGARRYDQHRGRRRKPELSAIYYAGAWQYARRTGLQFQRLGFELAGS